MVNMQEANPPKNNLINKDIGSLFLSLKYTNSNIKTTGNTAKTNKSTKYDDILSPHNFLLLV